ncbi:MAG: enoyl-CoA hydratase/isomerase family protein [Actinobacteria bacterium]|nr:enoyl-CoA hydratase/isomerase family protein [Actinomycetota bacterium]NIS34650.1 enoyl-CoA hydratase/isomerase family protein [Actinomycetota bacterium]NIT97914.1 enoyl-CoA hydratase/isomerase family protein [Actinomycetota bacterium]NIU17991.1 enoyl-CoA hydratase/isomerase family protein [Actinomycetota bacterium]NIU69410.1 enoyl-CoA hydratase/isomerase family protein [Actinomycetota bacterium]
MSSDSGHRADYGSFETITVEIDDHVAWVTLNRPEAYNAFTPTMQEELRATWRAFRRDDDVRVVVLTAAGDKAFCVGIDRNEGDFTALDDSDHLYGTSNDFMYDDPGDDLGPKSCDLWKPVVVAVNGMACGGAFYMLAEADVIIGADHATFFDPHVTYGMAAVYEPMKMLQRMPLGEILRLSLLGNHERMTAETAQRIGLVSEVCPAAELRERAQWVADAIASQPPVAVQATMRAIWAANDLGRLNAISVAPAILTTGFDRAGMEAGVESFGGGGRIEPRTR